MARVSIALKATAGDSWVAGAARKAIAAAIKHKMIIILLHGIASFCVSGGDTQEGSVEVSIFWWLAPRESNRDYVQTIV